MAGGGRLRAAFDLPGGPEAREGYSALGSQGCLFVGILNGSPVRHKVSSGVRLIRFVTSQGRDGLVCHACPYEHVSLVFDVRSGPESLEQLLTAAAEGADA